jgi:phasin family protein
MLHCSIRLPKGRRRLQQSDQTASVVPTSHRVSDDGGLAGDRHRDKDMKNGFETMTKGFEQFSSFGKGGFEAYVQAATVFAKTFERVNGEMFNFSKQQMEDGVAAFKAVSGAKSVHEAWELQTDFAKSALDAYVAQATKLNDLWLDAAKQAAEPFTNRFAEMTEKMQEFKAPAARAAE